MVLTVTLNPCIDRVVFVSDLRLHDANRVTKTEIDAGGKGLNLSRVFAELGGSSVATGFLGGGAGAHIREVLDAQRVVHRFVRVGGETRTNVSIESGDGPPTTLNEPGPTLAPEDLDNLLRLLPELFFAAKWIAMGGSLPPGVPVEIYRTMGEMARAAGLKVLVDADKAPMAAALAMKPDLIKPNGSEAERLLGRPVTTLEEATSAAAELVSHVADKGSAIVSMGALGAVLATADRIWIGEAPKVEAKSTIGSGDSLLAGFLWALEEGHSHAEALRWGVACGAATATTSGAEIARLPVILKLLPQVTVRPA